MAGGFSSLRNATSRREHKERSQPHKRRNKGLLEKKKDYKERSTNYKKKKEIISTLKTKASFRNEDEYYTAMNRLKTKDGVHDSDLARKNNVHHDEISVLKQQDRAYLRLKKVMNDKKIEKLQQSLSLLDNINRIEVVRGVGVLGKEKGKMEERGEIKENKNEDYDEDDEVASEVLKLPQSKLYHTKANMKRNQHKIFLDSKEDVETFDPVSHFQSSRRQLTQVYNRPRYWKNNSNSRDDEEEAEKEEKGKEKNKDYVDIDFGINSNLNADADTDIDTGTSDRDTDTDKNTDTENGVDLDIDREGEEEAEEEEEEDERTRKTGLQTIRPIFEIISSSSSCSTKSGRNTLDSSCLRSPLFFKANSLLSSDPSQYHGLHHESTSTSNRSQDKHNLTKIHKYRKAMYKELEDRANRSKMLGKTIQHLDLEYNLMGKGSKMKVQDGTRDGGAAHWVWKRERK